MTPQRPQFWDEGKFVVQMLQVTMLRLRDQILEVGFYFMLGISALTLIYPWRFRKRTSRILVHLPLLLIAIYPI